MGLVNKEKKVVLTFGVLAIFSYIAISIFPTAFRFLNMQRQLYHQYYNRNKGDNATIYPGLTNIQQDKTHQDKVAKLSKSDKSDQNKTDRPVSVAVGLAITSRGVPRNSTINQMEMFQTFLPSFCRTASIGFVYVFYIGYDHSDEFFRFTKWRDSFHQAFINITRETCQRRDVNITGVRFVECPYEGKPTWAQNDALRNAYLDDVDYYYRVNDDTEFTTVDWTVKFVDALNNYDPPNLGVVGPTHLHGNVFILTYDFVHRTHIDLFGFYYPRLFMDWSADNWITNVYKPDRSRKLPDVFLTHTLRLKTRYTIHRITDLKKHYQLNLDRKTIQRYIDYKRQRMQISNRNRSKNVISISLTQNKPKYVWGVIRNAQLAPVLFPDWTLRVYIPSRNCSSNTSFTSNTSFSNNTSFTKNCNIEPRVISTLQRLGAEVVHVKHKLEPNKLFLEYIGIAVIEDPNVDYFLIRNCEGRLSERDAIAVADLMRIAEEKKSDNSALHCLRDHPSHAKQPLVAGLWGGRSKSFRERFNCSTLDILAYISGLDVRYCDSVKSLISNLSFSKFNETRTSGVALETNLTEGQGHQSILNSHARFKENIDLVNDVIWPLMSSVAYCHDSVSCQNWEGAHPFPGRRENEQYLGRLYDANQEPVDEIMDIKSNENLACIK